MSKYNKAFTMGEVLIVLTIVGIIMALSLKTIKMVKSSYTPLAYHAYYTVKDVANILTSSVLSQDTIIDDSGTIRKGTTIKCNDNGKIVTILKPDGYNNNTIPACSSITTGSGTSTVCNAIVNDIVNTTNMGSTTNATPGCDTSKIYSVDTSGTEPTISSLGDNLNSPTFTTTNGMRYYLTHNVAAISGKTKYGFRLLAVDLNGKSAPNITEVTNKVPPDVVTFMIMDNGDVFPLGAAADNVSIKIDSKTPPTTQKYSYINAAMKGYCYPRNEDESKKSRELWHCPVTSGAYVPPECEVTMKIDNSKAGKRCNYLVEKPIEPQSFRNAYCATRGNVYFAKDASGNIVTTDEISYKTYCPDNATLNLSFRAVCPPYLASVDASTAKVFDRCDMELVKPIFRFNFR